MTRPAPALPPVAALHPMPPARRARATRNRVVRLALAAAMASVALGTSAQERPALLAALEKQGVTVVGPLPGTGGLSAWAAYMGRQPLALYLTPDGKHVIAGTLLDAEGKDLNQAALEKAVRQPMSDAVLGRLAQSTWLADGQSKAPRTVYVFTDPNCPYCNKLWADARPWVDQGRVQLRHVIVGTLTPTSPAKAAALLAAKNPAQALDAYERGHAEANTKALATGRPRPLGDAGLKPLTAIPPAIQAQLDANERLMAELGLRATPAVVWKDESGTVQMLTGVPDGALPRVLGPR